MRWHWVYRDFLRAFHGSSAEADWVASYTRLYLEPHQDTLARLHFGPKGFPTTMAVLQRVQHLGRRRYARTVEALVQGPDVEAALPTAVTEWLALLNAPAPDIALYPIVGLDCTTIYSIADGTERATVLCLEAVDGDAAGLRWLLAHEAHHWARQARWGEVLTGSVGERLATEGLAIAFSRQARPELAAWACCLVPEATYRWVETHQVALGALIHPRLDEGTLMDALFARTPSALPLPGMPARTGYVYGYLAAEAAVNRGLVDHGVGVPWREVLSSRP